MSEIVQNIHRILMFKPVSFTLTLLVILNAQCFLLVCVYPYRAVVVFEVFFMSHEYLLILFYREVYVDPETDVPYDILMSKVDVKYGMFGLNNFYKMQVRSSYFCLGAVERT